MRLLLDSHGFLWWIANDPRLSAAARQAIGDPNNEVFFSIAAAWEIAIKARLARDAIFQTSRDPGEIVPAAVSANGFLVLRVELEHALRVYSLPDHHRDPFDRLLVAQAQLEGLTIVSRDPAIAQYDVPVVW